MTALRPSNRAPAQIQPGKPGTKPFRVPYGQGLFMWVTPRGPNTEGTRSWRTKFKIDGIERLITLGHYPDMSLAEAHDERLRVRRNTAKGVDSLAERRQEQARELARRTQTFEAMARAWCAKRTPDWTGPYAADVKRRLGFCYDEIGDRPIAEIKRRDIIDLLEKVKTEHGIWTTNMVRQHLSLAFDYWMLREEIDRNPVAGLEKVDAFKVPDKNRRPAALLIDDARIVLGKVEALRLSARPEGSVGGSYARPVSRMVLLYHRMLALTGLRPSEVRCARWNEFHNGVWHVPAERMKGRRGRKRPHTVFLSRQALEVLEAARLLQGVGGGNGYVFSTDRDPLSRSTMSEVMKGAMDGAVGSDGRPLRHVPHGWRASMSTILGQMQPHLKVVIDAMLAHASKGAVQGRYDRTEVDTHYRAEATKLGQLWANELLKGAPDAFTLAGIKRTNNVVPLARNRKARSHAFIDSLRDVAD